MCDLIYWVNCNSTRLHRADTCAARRLASRQLSARFRQRTRLTRQLCTRSILYRTPLHRLRGMLSLIPTAANCRDSQEINRARPARISPLRGSRRRTLAALRVRLMRNRREREAAKYREAARLRPARTVIAHESLLAGKTPAIRREASPGQRHQQ